MSPPSKPEIGAPCNGCGLCCIATVCSAGSFALGLVSSYGERVAGPCPALTEDQSGALVCGVMVRPKDWLRVSGGAADIRKDFGLLIGAGSGCDDRGDSDTPEDIAAVRRVVTAYLDQHGVERLRKAAAHIFGGKI